MRPGRDDGPAGCDDGGCRDGDGDGDGGEGERRWELQRNRHAGRVREGYEVVVERGEVGGLVGGLREGDMVELVAEARYPGWENRVWEAGIRVEGVDELGVEGEGEGWEGEL